MEHRAGAGWGQPSGGSTLQGAARPLPRWAAGHKKTLCAGTSPLSRWLTTFKVTAEPEGNSDDASPRCGIQGESSTTSHGCFLLLCLPPCPHSFFFFFHSRIIPPPLRPLSSPARPSVPRGSLVRRCRPDPAVVWVLSGHLTPRLSQPNHRRFGCARVDFFQRPCGSVIGNVSPFSGSGSWPRGGKRLSGCQKASGVASPLSHGRYVCSGAHSPHDGGRDCSKDPVDVCVLCASPAQRAWAERGVEGRVCRTGAVQHDGGCDRASGGGVATRVGTPTPLRLCKPTMKGGLWQRTDFSSLASPRGGGKAHPGGQPLLTSYSTDARSQSGSVGHPPSPPLSLPPSPGLPRVNSARCGGRAVHVGISCGPHIRTVT